MDYSAPLDARGSDGIAGGGSVQLHRCYPSASAATITDIEVPVALETSVQTKPLSRPPSNPTLGNQRNYVIKLTQ
jgi:hypothetical protein